MAFLFDNLSANDYIKPVLNEGDVVQLITDIGVIPSILVLLPMVVATLMLFIAFFMYSGVGIYLLGDDWKKCEVLLKKIQTYTLCSSAMFVFASLEMIFVRRHLLGARSDSVEYSELVFFAAVSLAGAVVSIGYMGLSTTYAKLLMPFYKRRVEARRIEDVEPQAAEQEQNEVQEAESEANL